MKKIEARHGTYDFSKEDLLKNPSAFHVRRAGTGNFKVELSPETIEQIDTILKEQLVHAERYVQLNNESELNQINSKKNMV